MADTGNQSQVVIQNFTFEPTEITASAGDTIVFTNFDDVPHLILSQSAEDSFDDTEEFDDSLLIVDGSNSITIPDDAAVGDVFYFYCGYLEEVMATPTGTITIK